MGLTQFAGFRRLSGLLVFAALLGVSAGPLALASSGSPMIEVGGAGAAGSDSEAALDETARIPARITADIVRAIVASGEYTVEEIADAELEAELSRRAGKRFEDHPWVIVRAGIGLPNLVFASIEIYVAREWTVELGAGTGLLPPIFEGAVRYRPEAMCWGCGGRNSLSLGVGVDGGFYGNNSDPTLVNGLLLMGSVDLMYMHRFAEHFGFVIGSRLGLGLVTERGYGYVNAWKFEPTVKVQLVQIGLVF